MHLWDREHELQVQWSMIQQTNMGECQEVIRIVALSNSRTKCKRSCPRSSMLNVADIARQVITLGALCFSSNDVIAKKNVFMPVFAYLQAKWKC